MLTKYQNLAYKIFGRKASKSPQIEYIKRALERGFFEIRADAYIAFAWMNALISSLAGLIFVFIYIMFLSPVLNLPKKLLSIIIPLPILLAALTYFITLTIPENRANKRKKDIDAKLPYALNFIAAMATAGITPAEIFRNLAEQPIYGEIHKEAAWIYRDIYMFNIDIITALRNAANRTPSIKFQEFLQGAITTITSGGDLKRYFLAKAEEYMRENRRIQKEFLNTLGILAESYVTVVVAAPLFLIIMFSVMISFSGGAPTSPIILYLIAFVMLPISHLGFALAISSMTPEV
ncbi:MAG: type II secretion system F family protein [Thermoplasmatales archaeon]|nr:type II secretion system F family protein [Thermoplasmatales archaeon]